MFFLINKNASYYWKQFTHLITVCDCGRIHNHILVGVGSKDEVMDYASLRILKLMFLWLVIFPYKYLCLYFLWSLVTLVVCFGVELNDF